MRIHPSLSGVILGAVVGWCSFGLLTPVLASESETITETYEVSGVPEINVEGFNGRIQIEGGSENEVNIRCTKYVNSWTGIGAARALDDIKVEIEREGNSIRIRAERPSKGAAGWLRGSGGVHISLEVPSEARITARTSNGPVTLEGVKGEIQLESTNGAIQIEETSGDITLETTNGSIVAELDGGRVRMTSTNGSLVVEGHAEQVTAATTNGRIVMDLASDPPSEINAGTTNGSITIDGRLIGRNEFRSSNGSITLALPSDSTFEVDAETSNGRVTSDFELHDVRSEKKRSLQGKRGESPKTSIVIRTSNSSIRLTEG